MPKEIFDRLQKKRVPVGRDVLESLDFESGLRQAFRTPPKPGVRTFVTETSAEGLPTSLDNYKDVSSLPGVATPGGAGRDIGKFEYNTPSADSDIKPRTLGIPGEQYGHPSNNTYNTVTRRIIESSSRPVMVWDGEDFEGDPWALAKSVGINVLSNKDFRAGYAVDGVLVAALFDSSDRDGYEFDIVVHPDWQRKHLGSELMDTALDLYEQNADAYGEEYTLNMDVVSPVAQRMLAERGFAEIGEEGDHVLMTRVAYQRRWKPGKRQNRSRGTARIKGKQRRRKNKNARRLYSKRWRKKNSNKASFKSSEKRRRKQNRRRRTASMTHVVKAFQQRRASVLTAPDIAFTIGPEELLGYIHSISPMSGMVTIELDEPNVSQLDSLPVEIFMRMAVFLTEDDIDAFYDLVDVELGPGAYEELDEDLVRQCARLYDRDPDADEFKNNCFDLTDQYDLSSMGADQLEAVTTDIIQGHIQEGFSRSREDADNPNIGDEYDPDLYYGEVDVER